MDYSLSEDLNSRISVHLSAHDRLVIENSSLRKAAVAILISAEQPQGYASIVVTLRTSRLNRHSNQFALPGGRLDHGEGVVEAALRETHEEVGLYLEAGSVLGLLDDFVTRSGFLITPVVVWAGHVDRFAPDPGEVAEVHRVPLSELNSDKVPETVIDKATGKPVFSALFPTIGHRMFAPTAALLYQFREVCLRGCSTRVSDAGQPEFTRN